MTYTPPTISGYNATPPSDDGSQTVSNKVLWSTIKTKIGDPLKNYIDAINTETANGFAATFLGDIVDKSSGFTVGTTDDGKWFNCTSALTAVLPPAASAGEGFKIVLFNNSSGSVIADGDSSETINGATTITSKAQYDAILLICTGTGWFAAKWQTGTPNQAESTIASASTTDIGSLATSNVIISGTTTITALGSSASVTYPVYRIRFTGILTFTHNGTSLIIPGAANITTAAGDTCTALYLGSGNWRIISYSKASGAATVAPSVATQAEMEAAAVNTSFATPANMLWHPGMIKYWVNFDGTGTPAIRTSYNVSSITDNGTGDWTINFTNALSTANHCPVGIGYDNNPTSYNHAMVKAVTTGSVRVTHFYSSISSFDSAIVCVAGLGDFA